MTYKNILTGEFISRPNRFIANVKVKGETCVCHVKNTGRCKELLVEGARVILEPSDNLFRKTKYDLVAVYKNSTLINVDSNAPNKIFSEYIPVMFKDATLIKPECRYKNSRFDFYIEVGGRRIFIEVKGVTLEENGVAMFPDAPTQRGLKHINELAHCVKNGYEAYIVFVIQMKGINKFVPNRKTHNEFAEALINAKKDGVNILAIDCIVTENSAVADTLVKVEL